MWDELAPAIEVALPPTTESSEHVMNNILGALLGERMQCWLLTDDEERIQAVCTTMVMGDPASNSTYLLIYSLYAYDNVVDQRFWDIGMTELKKFAESKGCISVCAYSVDNAIDRIAKRLNAFKKAFYTFNL
jgi:hypothetical protein